MKKNESPTKFVSKKRVGTTIDSNILEQDFSTVLKEPQNGLIRKDNVLMQYFEQERGKNGRRKYSKIVKQKQTGYIGQSTINEKNQKEHSVIKNHYTSLKDFAYYGSATELVRASISDIIKRFPGAIFWPDDKSQIYKIDNKEYLEISNEFEIDCWTFIQPNVENPMRHLVMSHENYIFYAHNSTTHDIAETPWVGLMVKDSNGSDVNVLEHLCPNTLIAQTNMGCLNLNQDTNKPGIWWPWIYCDENGKIRLLADSTYVNHNDINVKGKLLLQPKEEVKDEFWRTLDDFESVLLNRMTNPLYLAYFDVPNFEEEGFKIEKQRFEWPKVKNSYSLLLSGPFYTTYVSRLADAAMFYDENVTDNIWRMLTHDSIKNLDATIIGSTKDDADIDSSRVESMLKLYGRQLDDIKRFVDDIKYKTSLKYDDNNSTPRELLKKSVENNGWRNTSIASSVDIVAGDSSFTEIKTDVNAFEGVSDGLYPSEVNDEFMKRLALNSAYLQSMKGTREGLEAILGLLGFKNNSGNSLTFGEYKITEQIAVAQHFIPVNEFSALRTYYGYTDDVTDGYPVAIDSESNVIVPWIKPNVKYDNNIYFQEKGGWGKMGKKTVYTTDDTETAVTGSFVYRETVPKIYYVKNRHELLTLGNKKEIFNNSIARVDDLSGFDDDELAVSNSSNYFILRNKGLYDIVGENGGYDTKYPYNEHGWDNISTDGDDWKRVLYSESVVFDNEGNNPHDGNSEYDDGDSFIDKFNRLFLEDLKNGKYDAELKCQDISAYNAILYSGFCLTKKNDDKKCHYFSEEEDNVATTVSNAEALYDMLSNVENGLTIKIGETDIICDKNLDKISGITPVTTVNSESQLEGYWTHNTISNGDVFYISSAFTSHDIEFEEGTYYEVYNNNGSQELRKIYFAFEANKYYKYSNNAFEKDTMLNTIVEDDNFYSGLTNPLESVSNSNVHAANSVVNLKNINIEFGGNNIYLKDYIKNIVLKYVEDMVPSSAIISYTFAGEPLQYRSQIQEFVFGNSHVTGGGGQAIATGEFAEGELSSDGLHLNNITEI